jgi:hypothetical protein
MDIPLQRSKPVERSFQKAAFRYQMESYAEGFKNGTNTFTQSIYLGHRQVVDNSEWQQRRRVSAQPTRSQSCTFLLFCALCFLCSYPLLFLCFILVRRSAGVQGAPL